MNSSTELRDVALNNLDEIAPSTQRIAIAQYGPSVYAKPETYVGSDVLVVCRNFDEGLRAHVRGTGGNEVRYLFAERDLIESDIKRGTLGDFLTERLLYPYRSISNQEYVDALAAEARSRVVKEEVKKLVLEFGEMCRGLVARPEFFPLSRMRTRARVFLPSLEDYQRLTDSEVRQRNMDHLRQTYKQTIASLPRDLLELDADDVTIADNAIDRWLKDRASEQVVDILQLGQRAFYSYIVRGRAIFLNLDLLAKELYSTLRLADLARIPSREIEDPKNYLYLRTVGSLVSLNERTSLEETVRKLRPGKPITVSPLAGVLNEVFLVTSGRERFVAKRFTDWHGFKWFTLNLVSIGSKLFALSGKARMTNEYGMNRYLAKRGLPVPEILHVSVKQRILLESYVAGKPLSELVAQAASGSVLSNQQRNLSEEMGETLARIHGVGVTVGDSKPENFVAKDREIYTIDLEQAGRRGDDAWDIAELLYYSGHYSNIATPTRALGEVVDGFIRGYLRKGRAEPLRRAAGVRYAKVFSFWTPAPVILEISRKLREAK